MARAATRSRSSKRPRALALRGGMAAVALAFGAASVLHSFAYAISKNAPESGYALSPGDGRVDALFAQGLLTAKAGLADHEAAARIARVALVREPLAVSAVAALALDAQLRGKTDEARRLFLHSDTISRRELSTRMWLIEDAVQHGNVASAVRNYDIALRTAPKTFDLLFPLLAGGIANPAIANALSSTLAKRPVWGEEFIRYMGNSAPDPKRTAGFFRLLSTRGIPVGATEQAGVVNTLVAANAFGDAWGYYQTLRQGVDRRRSRDAEFTEQFNAPTAFDWTPRMTGSGITASIQRNGKNGIFEFAAPSTVGGIVLEQLQLLPAGRYRLMGRSIGIDQAPESAPYWLLVCTDGRELGRVALANSSQGDGRFDGSFTVSRSCPAQVLRLMVRPSSAVSGVSGQIESVVLEPL